MRRDGWVRLDANPSKAPDILATIPPLPSEVKSQTWDEIELIHGIGSFYPWEAEQLLQEIQSILEPGGKVVLEQPDATKCDPVSHPEWLFGDPALREPMHMNRWAYTPQKLADLLMGIGFKRVELLSAQHHVPGRDFRMEAYR